MKKLVMMSLMLIAALGLQAQNLQSVLDDHFAAMKFDEVGNINTMQMEGKMSLMGAELPMKMFKKNPGMLRIEGDFMGNKFVQAINGDKGWMVAPWTGSSDPKALGSAEVEQLKAQASIQGPLYNAKRDGTALTYKGETTLDGKSVYQIDMVDKAGNESTHYINKETNYLFAVVTTVESNGQAQAVKLIYGDYQLVGGFPVAHSIRTFAGPTEALTVTFTNIKINESLSDSLFEM